MTEQGTHHFILTLQIPTSHGFATSTVRDVITPPEGWTRSQVYKALLEEFTARNMQYRGATTVFFSLERNEL